MTTNVSSIKDSSQIAFPAEKLVDDVRARAILAAAKIDLVCAKQDINLFYLSGHASDSSLCHFYDEWACALYPASSTVAGALIVPDYDLAYQVTRPTSMPDLLTYGSEWSSAGILLKEINDGVGVDTALRHPLRELFAKTRPRATATLVAAIKSYVEKNFGSKPLTIACDDLHFSPILQETLGERVTLVDARPVMRKIRAVKTAPEMQLLRDAAHINDAALENAAKQIRVGGRWDEMVKGYRDVLAKKGAKTLGERGMLFNSGPDGAFVLDHRYAASKAFTMGDTVVLDTICQYKLYHADMARSAIVGPPSLRQKQMYAAVVETLNAMESRLKAGMHTDELTKIAGQVMIKHGFSERQTTLLFHPIGLEVFDYAEPAHMTDGWKLEANSVVNFEVFYRDAGFESLSNLSRELMILE
jgi:Xaa-Pro aminopeptidase